MIFMTIIGSILLFPAGNLRYIDALFFAAGSATQSGLNTVDVNKLNLYQQVGGSISFERHSIQGMRAAETKNHWVYALQRELQLRRRGFWGNSSFTIAGQPSDIFHCILLIRILQRWRSSIPSLLVQGLSLL